uniref:Cell adhesion molecule n=1 Tax=Rhipicephalus zambeziensis TaxID=60191 RepID=A0A224YJI8_9ACAR
MDGRRMIVTALVLLVLPADISSLEGDPEISIPRDQAAYGLSGIGSGNSPAFSSGEQYEPSVQLSFKDDSSVSNYGDEVGPLTIDSSPIQRTEQADRGVGDEAPIAINILGVNNAPQYEETAKNCSGRCDAGAEVRADTKVGSPSAVRNLTVNQTVPGEVVYSWQRPDIPNGPLDGYIVTTGNLETKKVLITEVPGNATELVQKTIEQYTQYKVDVQAYNIMNPYGLKQAGPAASVEFKSLGKGPIPPIPELGDTFEHEVLVNWTKPTDLQHYVTHYALRLEKTAVNITVKTTSVWLECLETWHSYTASVSSCTASNTCGPPKKLYFETDVGAPDTPRNLTNTGVTRYSIKLTWNSPEQVRGPLDGYKVTFVNESKAFDIITKDTKIAVGNLSANCIYNVFVSAFNHGAHQTKEGPAAAIQVKTLYGPKPASPWFSVTTITLMVVVPVVCFVLLSVYVVYKQLLKKREDEELLASSQS